MVKNVFKKLGKKQKNNKGFSLVELIVVIAIMAVLVGVLAPQLIKYVEKSREATDIQNCDSIATTLKTYYSDKEGAPDTIKVTVSKNTDPVIEPTTQTPLKDTGLETTRLKGTKWNGNIDITYTMWQQEKLHIQHHLIIILQLKQTIRLNRKINF